LKNIYQKDPWNNIIKDTIVGLKPDLIASARIGHQIVAGSEDKNLSYEY